MHLSSNLKSGKDVHEEGSISFTHKLGARGTYLHLYVPQAGRDGRVADGTKAGATRFLVLPTSISGRYRVLPPTSPIYPFILFETCSMFTRFLRFYFCSGPIGAARTPGQSKCQVPRLFHLWPHAHDRRHWSARCWALSISPMTDEHSRANENRRLHQDVSRNLGHDVLHTRDGPQGTPARGRDETTRQTLAPFRLHPAIGGEDTVRTPPEHVPAYGWSGAVRPAKSLGTDVRVQSQSSAGAALLPGEISRALRRFCGRLPCAPGTLTPHPHPQTGVPHKTRGNMACECRNTPRESGAGPSCHCASHLGMYVFALLDEATESCKLDAPSLGKSEPNNIADEAPSVNLANIYQQIAKQQCGDSGAASLHTGSRDLEPGSAVSEVTNGIYDCCEGFTRHNDWGPAAMLPWRR